MTPDIAKDNRAIITLGGGLSVDNRPNLNTIARLDAAHFLYHFGNFPRIITTSGGTFRDPLKDSRPLTEADAGADYLIARGIPSRVLLRQGKALDTIGEPYFCEVEFLQPYGIEKLTVVSNEFHTPRVRQLFELVLGDRYQIQYVSVDNRGMSAEKLAKQRKHEALMMSFYQEQFCGVTSGDLSAVETYLFDHDPAYTGRMNDVHQELTQRVKAIWEN